jgi:predicted nucleic acid-binding protein
MMIAATALVRGWSVVTRNERRFGRVPGLDVIAVR